MSQIFEAIMLICFGVSWPVSVLKSWRSKTSEGKSLLFLCLIETGYLVGIIGKAVFQPGWVLVVYSVNLLFVTADLILYFRNRKMKATDHSTIA